MKTLAKGDGILALRGLVVGLMLLLGSLLMGTAEEMKPPPELTAPRQWTAPELTAPRQWTAPQLSLPPQPTAPQVTLKETKTEVKIELPGDVLFDFDKADIRPDAEPVLQQAVEIIQRYPRAQVAIAGHTDARGADAYNLRLSEQRAMAVKAWLVQHGDVEGKPITTRGWGKAKPVAPNTHRDGSDNPEGRQKNRRVEITVKK